MALDYTPEDHAREIAASKELGAVYRDLRALTTRVHHLDNTDWYRELQTLTEMAEKFRLAAHQRHMNACELQRLQQRQEDANA